MAKPEPVTSCRYDPDVTPAYQQLAAHYGTAIVPARPYNPKNKAQAKPTYKSLNAGYSLGYATKPSSLWQN